MANEVENVYKVKLVSQRFSNQRVTFDVTPDIIENRNVNYKTIDPIHAPGQIQAFATTSSRNYNVANARLISRTVDEADKNLKRLWLLRSWTMPRFGQSTLTRDQAEFRERGFQADLSDQGGTFANQRLEFQQEAQRSGGQERRGEPPEVLLLSAYSRPGNQVGRTRSIGQHIFKVPVVLQQLSIPYPSDQDYIHTSEFVPMPMIMTLDMTLMETHSVTEYERFSLDSFKRGLLTSF